jgi:DNA-binding beta-propeller fold protein YncE
MNTQKEMLLTAVGLCLITLLPGRGLAADGPYRLLKTIPVGGEGGSWDYLSIDEVNRRLYVSHANTVAVVDIEKDALAGVITNTPGVHGLAPVPELQRGFTTNGRENKAGVVDLKTLQTVSKIETGPSPDGFLYEPGRKEVYIFNGRGQSATIIDAKEAKAVATIPLDGRPESAAADPAAGRVYDNLEDKSLVAAIDTKTHEVVARWPVAPGQYPSGLAIDAAHHRLFIGCHNQLLVMMDSTNGKVLANVPIGARVDAVAFDPETQFVFASCGDGTLTIAHEDAPDKLTVVQTLATERGSRTLALDPKTHRVFVATAKFAAPPPVVPGTPRQGPHLIPETFGVLVYELHP